MAWPDRPVHHPLREAVSQRSEMADGSRIGGIRLRLFRPTGRGWRTHCRAHERSV